MQTTACLRKGDDYMDKSKTHILAFFTGHDAPGRKSAYVEMNGQGDELTQLVASAAIKMFSLGTTNKNIIQMRKQYLFGIINKWLDENKGEKENGNDGSAGRKNPNVGWGRISRMRNAGTSHHDWMADC